MSATDNIAYEGIEYKLMRKRWALAVDLLGGTYTMQQRGRTWLPQFRLESALDYKQRLLGTTLYPAFGDAIDTIVDKAFSQEVTVKGEDKLSERLAPLLDNMDGGGASITDFSNELMRKAWTFGIVHVMPRFPSTNATQFKDSEESEAPQPFFTIVSPMNVIGWKSADDEDDGTRVLTEVRIREMSIESDPNSYIERPTIRIRKLTATTWEVWEQVKAGWQKVLEGSHTFGEVPFRTYYERRATNDDNAGWGNQSGISLPVSGFSGFMTALPPFEELAYQNLAHWQSSSDQTNIMHVARVPLLAGAGVSEDQKENGVKIAANGLIALPAADSKLFFVEHSGKAIEAGERDLEAREIKMQKLAFEPLTNTVRVTATREIRDEHKGENRAQSSVRGLNRFLRQLFDDAASWIGEEIPEDVSFHIFDDFGIDARGVEEITALIQARATGTITHKTCLEEMKRRAFLRDSVDVELEIEGVKNDPPPGLMAGADIQNPKSSNADPNATKDPNKQSDPNATKNTKAA